jgi:hypothetical protein
MTPPIRDAITLVRTALYGALSPLVDDFNGKPACYWQRVEEGVADALVANPPTLTACFVYQSQDNGGKQDVTIGDRGWSGLVTIRALAGSLRAAETLLASIPDPLVLSATGYDITAIFDRPLVLPVVENVHTAASIYRISIRRTS